MYYGEEIGMSNGEIAPDQVKDPAERNQPGIGQGRDPRTAPPMLWDQKPNAGFTTGSPWLPVHPNYKGMTVEAQQRDARSILSLSKQLLHLRNVTPAPACRRTSRTSSRRDTSSATAAILAPSVYRLS